MAQASQAKHSAILEISRWLAAFVALGILVWIPRTPVLFFALCAGTPLEFYEADLNHDEYVSVVEAGYACNLDSRPVKRHGHACTEYYNRVDWQPIKEICE